jgi:hypothetical protein
VGYSAGASVGSAVGLSVGSSAGAAVGATVGSGVASPPQAVAKTANKVTTAMNFTTFNIKKPALILFTILLSSNSRKERRG